MFRVYINHVLEWNQGLHVPRRLCRPLRNASMKAFMQLVSLSSYTFLYDNHTTSLLTKVCLPYFWHSSLNVGSLLTICKFSFDRIKFSTLWKFLLFSNQVHSVNLPMIHITCLKSVHLSLCTCYASCDMCISYLWSLLWSAFWLNEGQRLSLFLSWVCSLLVFSSFWGLQKTSCMFMYICIYKGLMLN